MGVHLGAGWARSLRVAGLALGLAVAVGAVAPHGASASGWTVQSCGQPWMLGDVAVIDDVHAFALPMAVPAVLVDLGDGVHWGTLATVFPSASALAAPDLAHLWAVGGTTVYLSRDGGQSWQVRLTDPDVAEFRDVSFSDASHGSVSGLLADGSGSVIRTTDDGGQTWTRAVVPVDVGGIDVTSPAHSWLIATGETAGVAMGSDDGGATWETAISFADARLFSVSFSDADNGVVSGSSDEDGPFVAVTTDGGAEWTIRQTAFSLTALTLTDASSGWAVARDAGGVGIDAVYATDDGGLHWERQWVGSGTLAAIDVAGGRVCSVGAAGLIVSSDGASAPPSADITRPTTVVAGADKSWHNHDVSLTFSAIDPEGPVAAVQVKIDDAATVSTEGDHTSLTVKAAADHKLDGRHKVAFRAVDEAGNVGAWRSVTVSIDTRPPKTVAPYEVGVKQTNVAQLPYSVSDAAPSSGIAKVTLVLTTPDGRVLKTLNVAQPDAGATLTAGVTCSYPLGLYRYEVRARDGAGNVQASTGAVSLVVTRRTVTHGFGALVAGSRLSYSSSATVPRVDTLPHDAAGVRMYQSGGKLYDYPGGQARYGLSNLNTYRLTGDEFFLERAMAQATRLLSTHVLWSGAWYYPQPYTRDRHNAPGETMKAPWYGGMAQGQVISLFTRMYDVTGDDKYLRAARRTLYSFIHPGPASRPWTVTVDGSRHLWIQEWPKLPLDCTFNGHMISAFGLYDYYCVTGDTLALLLFRSAASTALDYAASFRRPGWISNYCLLHRIPNKKYHQVHISCLLRLYTLTGEPGFARFADVFIHDYPPPSVDATVRVMPGTYTAKRFDADQRQRAARTVTVTTPTLAHCVQRMRVCGAIRLLTTDGPWAGYWLREQPSHVVLLGKVAGVSYDPDRRITLRAGQRYTGQRYNDEGTVLGTLAAVASRTTNAHVGLRAIVNGTDRVLVMDGDWQGYWLPVKGLELR